MKSWVGFLFAFLGIALIICFCDKARGEPHIKGAEAPKETLNECPHYKFKLDFEDCRYCHVGSAWKVKEVEPEDGYNWPMHTRINDDVGHFLFTDVTPNWVAQFFQYLIKHDIKKAVIELHCPGGSLMDAKRILGLMDHYKSWGGEIETRCYGYAASAAFYVMMNATEGMRYIHPQAEIMWHELWTFKFLSLETPSDSEDEAAMLRHFQDTVNKFIAERCDLTKEEIDELVHKKDFWINGVEAVELGFADHLIK